MQTTEQSDNEYRSVPVTALQESSTNPRRRFDETNLKELAASFKSQEERQESRCGKQAQARQEAYRHIANSKWSVRRSIKLLRPYSLVGAVSCIVLDPPSLSLRPRRNN